MELHVATGAGAGLTAAAVKIASAVEVASPIAIPSAVKLSVGACAPADVGVRVDAGTLHVGAYVGVGARTALNVGAGRIGELHVGASAGFSIRARRIGELHIGASASISIRAGRIGQVDVGAGCLDISAGANVGVGLTGCPGARLLSDRSADPHADRQGWGRKYNVSLHGDFSC